MGARTRRRPRRLITTTLAVTALFAAACGGDNGNGGDDGAAPDSADGEVDWATVTATGDDADASRDDLIAAAQEEGQLTYYGDANEASLRAWLDGFEEEYDIDVSILRQPGSALYEQWQQETSAGQHQADVVSIADLPPMEDAVEAGHIAEYTPEGDGLFPEDITRSGHLYPVQNFFTQTVSFNSDQLDDDEIARLEEDPFGTLASEDFDGRVATGSPYASQQAAAFYNSIDRDLLERIREGGATSYDDSLALMERIVSGEHAVGIGITDSLIASQAMAGAPVRWVYPDPAVAGAFAVGISANAPHPAAARLLMEWATSPEASERYSSITQTPPSNAEASDDREILETDWYQTPSDEQLFFGWIDDEEIQAQIAEDGEFFEWWSATFG
ncbi:ABC transporter substrate-binding protein [Egicoccus halophilus]|uniref:Iron(III) transport system substrate-binding protein n=1 Tax=Egicoccus halophilus TaxID=1670830 RepID=A0A8J3AGS8_9ACTN|nr:ABC transporter substrate-binding protein [Egicoccus halophilus]GGI08693.1 hypothetical protein GCM10011354_30370 [Egicoccus halophilus]